MDLQSQIPSKSRITPKRRSYNIINWKHDRLVRKKSERIDESQCKREEYVLLLKKRPCTDCGDKFLPEAMNMIIFMVIK
jgi:hypothetical protein